MTTVQTSYHDVVSGDMSYDEIDFAGRLGEDDIDIDIDLETGQNDEDYILEDIDSDADHGEAFISNDDVMIDDENVSYPMDDVDALHGEHIDMEDADLSDIPGSELNNPEIDITPQGNHSLHSVGFDEASDTVIVESDFHEEPLGYIEAEKLTGEQSLTEETEFPNKTVNAESALAPPASPTQSEPGALFGASQHIPPADPGDSHSFGSDLGSGDSSGQVVAFEVVAVAEQIQEELEVKSGENDNIALAAERVIVRYRDVEYALCSSSESDDPDTFFLKDSNLVNGSLANLLAGLREVIHEDLGSEDELCITADDLGIEIGETCMSVHDVNFAHLMDLHERLLRNDGVETPGPLYVTLGTKPDFAKRLANLASAAAEGKGMSDFISWDGESEDFEENTRENDQLKTADQTFEPLHTPAQRHQSEFAGEGSVAEQLTENVDSEENRGSEAQEFVASQDHGEEQTLKDHSRLATSDNVSPVINGHDQGSTNDTQSTAQSAETYDYSKDGLDEDGDLIDYEDEEYEKSRETSASTNVDSSGKQTGNSQYFVTPCSGLTSCMCPSCMKLPLIYDEEKTPALDQHPLSPASKEDEHAYDEESEFARYQEHENYGPGDELTHDQLGEENLHDSEEFHHSYDGMQEEEVGKNAHATPDVIATIQGFLSPPGLDHQPGALETGADDHKETDLNAAGEDLAAIGQRGQPVTARQFGQDDDEISYEEADIPESNESERTLIAEEPAAGHNFDGTKEENDDEINYDTDDQEELKNPAEQNSTSKASPVFNGQKGKRQRADAEESADRASKQWKRARP